MTTSTAIFLSFEAPTKGWQSSNLVQIIDDQIHIFIQPDSLYPLRDIQKAGRKIDGLGVKHITFAGENWGSNRQWALAMGFTSVGKLTAVDFVGDKQEALTKKLAVYAWSRDLTNQTPAELYPASIAEQTVQYLTQLGGGHVSSTIISGEALAEQGWMGTYNVGKGSINPPCLLEVDYNPNR